jgi:diguanylate cyclase (GGDEF)-like protein
LNFGRHGFFALRGPAAQSSWFCAAFVAALFWCCAICSGGLAAGVRTAVFSDPAPFIELRSFLSRYHTASTIDADGSEWEILTASNRSGRPVSRILVAEDLPDSGLQLQPPAVRPAIRQVAASDPDVAVEPGPSYGRHAYRVTLPAATTVSLAIRLSDVSMSPSVAAWDEAALVAHNEQLAVFRAAVASLILSALAIASGLAVMTGGAAQRWAAFTLLGLFVSRLAATGLFDAIGPTNLGGPDGLSAALAGLTLAAGLHLANAIAPVGARSWPSSAAMALLGASLAAYVGFPVAALVTQCAVVVGAAIIAVHLVRSGRRGSAPARAAAPAAILFAVATMVGACAALGAPGISAVAPSLTGGFSSAAAILLTLAIAADSELASRSAAGRRIAQPAALAHENSPQVQFAPTALDAMTASHQGIFELRVPNGAVRLSPEAAVLIGLDASPASFALEDWVTRIHPDDRGVFRAAIRDFGGQTGLAFRIEFRIAHQNGRQAWLELRASTQGGRNSETCLGLLADITTRKEPGPAPRLDALTELPNRRALTDDLVCLGPRPATAVLALLDIDRFKSVHASLGDGGADAVLADCARRLKDSFSPLGRVYRVGGDGFAVLFEELDGNGASIGGQIVQIVSEPVNLQTRAVYLSVSVGVARGGDAVTATDLFRNAELALFEAKRLGGGCARSYAPDLAAIEATDTVALEADLRRALANDEVEVVYQPIMRLDDGSVSGFEALLRWTHPVRGRVETQRFIAHSEESGAILELGKLALAQAAAELARWQKYFPLEPALTVSVNLSRRQLQDTEFGALLTEVLADGNLHQGTLKLELTETALGSVDGARDHLMRLKTTGVGLSLDDFGTGLSALSQLKDLPFDTIKIDKSFLDQGEGREKVAILRSIVQLARDLKLDVVAEGVETARDAQWLKEIGCEFAQGYFFSPPLPRGDVLAFIARHHAGLENPDARRSGVAGMSGKSGDVDTKLA